MTDFSGPICSMCTRDWDERLGYCEYCEGVKDSAAKVDKKAKKAKKNFTVVTAPFTTDTPLYEQLALDFGFAPDQSSDWRNMPGGVGMLEDNFS